MSAEATPLRRRYERLMVVYPRSYRAAHGAELVGTLLEGAAPGQRFPVVREIRGLVVAGLGARARQATAGAPPWWMDGLHLGVFLLVLANLGATIHSWWTWPWLALSVLVVLATMRGWVRVALPLALLASLQVSRPLLHDILPDRVNGLPFYGPGYGELAPVAPYLASVLGLAVLVVFATRSKGPQPLRRRSWWWLVVPAVAGVITGLDQGGSGSVRAAWLWALGGAALEVLALTAALVATVLVRDARWAVAAAVYLVPGMVWLGRNGGQMHVLGIAYWAALAGLTIAVVVAAARPRRRIDA